MTDANEQTWAAAGIIYGKIREILPTGHLLMTEGPTPDSIQYRWGISGRGKVWNTNHVVDFHALAHAKSPQAMGEMIGVQIREQAEKHNLLEPTAEYDDVRAKLHAHRAQRIAAAQAKSESKDESA